MARRKDAGRAATQEGTRRSNTGDKEGTRRSNTLFWQLKRVLGGVTDRERGYSEEQPHDKTGCSEEQIPSKQGIRRSNVQHKWQNRVLGGATPRQNRVLGGADIFRKTNFFKQLKDILPPYSLTF